MNLQQKQNVGLATIAPYFAEEISDNAFILGHQEHDNSLIAMLLNYKKLRQLC